GIDFDRPLLLGYTGLSDVLLRKYIADSAHLWADYTDELPTSIVGSVVGTHAGPGAVALAFFKKK
ncbi:MAG: DegV family protein, partial [Oscillospiraceae bacterium]|nr:DegV family protein [Oscillospiraceae bacterium]